MEPLAAKDAEHKHRNRLKGLFNKVKSASTDAEVNDFLRGPSDKLSFTGHPPLSPIDTSSASRWPAARELAWPPRSRTESPKRNRKDLSVHFKDGQPDIIGEGGDEAEMPTAEISKRKRSHSHPLTNSTQLVSSGYSLPLRSPTYGPDSRQPAYGDVHSPGFLPRAQTGYETGPRAQEIVRDVQNYLPELGSVSFLGSDGYAKQDSQDPTSFAARIKAEMAASEGRAFLQASRSNIEMMDPTGRNSLSPPPNSDLDPTMDELQINTIKNLHISSSPGFPIQSQAESPRPRTPNSGEANTFFTESPESLVRKPTSDPQAAALVVGDEALKEFSRRTAHLTTLFRLSTEASKSIPQSSMQEIVRAALWWFLKGRLNLEATIRDRSSNPQAQHPNLFSRQQAYADLAKSLWLVVSAMPQCKDFSTWTGRQSPNVDEVSESRQGILSNLRKLCMSMQRNNILPPSGDDAPLIQGLDCTIWLQDEGNRALPQNQRQSSILPLHDTFAIGDTTRYFHYARVFANVVLVEEAYHQQYLTQVLVSIIRDHGDTSLTAVIASQNGMINLCIQGDKNRGTVWDDVSWWPTTNTVDIRLPRGFKMQIQCTEPDFKTLLGIYDYHKKTYSGLEQQQNEEVAFEGIVKTCQLFEQTGALPREPFPRCRIVVFEKSTVERAASGARKMHRGFRLALVTGPKTKLLRGINQDFPSSRPLQSGLLRGDGGSSALLLKVDDEKSKFAIVLTFDDVSQRTQLYSKLNGTALQGEEETVCGGKLKIFSVISPLSEPVSFQSLKFLDWQTFTIINSNTDDASIPKTIQSDHLRVSLDFKTGTLTDRINVGPGELNIRLDVNAFPELKILRKPQQDLTICISEAQVSKELPQELTALLKILTTSPSVRTYTFPSLTDLHAFQTAITGFTVLFDAVASSFAISRRRMVVPIYKKWDAARTRIQVVRREKVVQLIAFFENFSHGEALNMALKSTDTFESTSRGGKYSLRIVDAKFALPRTRGAEKEGDGGEKRNGKDGGSKDGKGQATSGTGSGIGDGEVGFVSMDLPEYPGEHDDITIFYDGQNDLDKFIQALPAPTKAASRMGSVTRR